MKYYQESLYRLIQERKILDYNLFVKQFAVAPHKLYFSNKADEESTLLHALINYSKCNDATKEAIVRTVSVCPELLDKRDYWGFTALHLAVMSEKIEFAIELIQLGANMNLVDNNMMYAYQYIACEEDYKQIAEHIDLPEWDAIQELRFKQRLFEQEHFTQSEANTKSFVEENDFRQEADRALAHNWINQAYRLYSDYGYLDTITVRQMKRLSSKNLKKFLIMIAEEGKFGKLNKRTKKWLINNYRYKSQPFLNIICQKGCIKGVNELLKDHNKSQYFSLFYLLKNFLANIIFNKLVCKIPKMQTYKEDLVNWKHPFRAKCKEGLSCVDYVKKYIDDGMLFEDGMLKGYSIETSEERELLFNSRRDPKLTKEQRKEIKYILRGAKPVRDALMQEIRL